MGFQDQFQREGRDGDALAQIAALVSSVVRTCGLCMLNIAIGLGGSKSLLEDHRKGLNVYRRPF